MAAPSGAEARRTLVVAVSALTVTQMIGWGTTFHVPAVLSERISDGTGLPTEIVFGGITLMLVVSAFVAPLVGRLLQREGARRWMMVGSCLAALALVTLASARGPLMFSLAWIVFGIVMPLALNQSASTALVQIAPGRARTAIALLLLLTGFSSTFAWPILIGLADAFGWRMALIVCAAAHLLICLPLHAFGLPKGRPVPPLDEPLPEGAVARNTAGAPIPPAKAKPPRVQGAFALAATAFSLGGMLTWGLPLLMVPIFKAYGHSEAVAVAVGALLGPSQVLARGFEMLGGRRIDILTVGVLAAILMPLALCALIAWGSLPAGLIAFTIGYGLSAGINSIVRAVAPIRLFGSEGYAVVLGRLSVPQNAAFAAAPLGFATILQNFGVTSVVVTALIVALVCLVTSALLARRAAAADELALAQRVSAAE